ncbi:hypothetical protein KZX29_11525 [Moraxella osloensis]|uniref:hypothetical protein n=1 Tax=Faucicola osloensis TaxID=34062 RepID=UPI002006678A|nr:hypothetical protein [Moraxella osloensis]MCK6159407.1 hypothetical protein [Moraxella osloensis]
MAVLTQSINDGFAQITTLLKQVNNTLKGNQGDLTKLGTADKTSLVNALNELKVTIDNKTSINDGQKTTSNTWSATKISNEITTAITNLINGADASSDTLKELADKITALAQADNGLVSANQAQSFTAAQKLQARNNIDVYSKAEIGDINTNFVNTINTTYNS